MISNSGHKRKASLDNNHISILNNHNNNNNNSISTMSKRFRGINYDGKLNQNEHRMSLLSSATTKIKSDQESKKMTIVNGEQKDLSRRLNESEMTPIMLAEYRRLQHELQCQEALLVLMQKLKTNQKLISQTNNNNTTTNNNGIKQRTTTPTPTTATKLSQQAQLNDSKVPLTATKQPITNSNRSIPTKPPHPNQYTVNRSNNNSHLSQQQQSSKNSLSTSQATRQSNTNNNNTNSTLPAAATRISSTVPQTATKNSAVTANTTNSSKSNGVAAEQHLLNAKLALRKQLEQTLLQIPTPKPSTCDLTFIPGVNGWSEFLAYIGMEQALNTYLDIVNRRPTNETSMTLPYVCAQCGTDWSVTWHDMSSTNTDNTNSDEKIFCDRCTKTSQKKLLKQDHSNRLRQAFIKALQQEKELDAKFQQQATSLPSTTATTTPPTNTVKQSSSSSSSQQQHSKHSQQQSHSSKHSSNKPLSTKTSSNHHHHHHNSTHNNHHSSHSHHHHHHHSSGKSSSSSKSHHHHTNPSTATPSIPNLTPSPAETLASTLAALQTNEQMELFQKHFLSNMLPFAVANQTAAAAAAALAAKSTQQQQQQAALAAFPAMAASLMRQPNPAQYLLDMIPQAAKQQQHHHHSK